MRASQIFTIGRTGGQVATMRGGRQKRQGRGVDFTKPVVGLRDGARAGERRRRKGNRKTTNRHSEGGEQCRRRQVVCC